MNSPANFSFEEQYLLISPEHSLARWSYIKRVCSMTIVVFALSWVIPVILRIGGYGDKLSSTISDIFFVGLWVYIFTILSWKRFHSSSVYSATITICFYVLMVISFFVITMSQLWNAWYIRGYTQPIWPVRSAVGQIVGSINHTFWDFISLRHTRKSTFTHIIDTGVSTAKIFFSIVFFFLIVLPIKKDPVTPQSVN